MVAEGQCKPSRRAGQGTDHSRGSGGENGTECTAQKHNSLELLEPRQRSLLLWLEQSNQAADPRLSLKGALNDLAGTIPTTELESLSMQTVMLYQMALGISISSLLKLAGLRLAEQLVEEQPIAKLEGAMRVLERLAQLQDEYPDEHDWAGQDQLMSSDEISGMVCEVRRLLAELEEETPELPDAGLDSPGATDE